MGWIQIAPNSCRHPSKPSDWKKYPEGSIWQCGFCDTCFRVGSYRGMKTFWQLDGEQ
jgi:hypothetical protein